MKSLPIIFLLSVFSWASNGRTFNGTSDCANTSAAVTLEASHAVAWSFEMNDTAFSTSDKIWSESSTNLNSNSGAYVLDPDQTGPQVQFTSSQGDGTHYDQFAFSQPATGIHRFALNLDTSSSPNSKALMNGVDQNAVQGLGTWSGAFADYTTYYMSRACSSLFRAGVFYDITIWDEGLSSIELQALSYGYPPRFIHPRHIRLDVVMLGNSPEKDLSGRGNNLTITGTTLSGKGHLSQPLYPYQGAAAY